MFLIENILFILLQGKDNFHLSGKIHLHPSSGIKAIDPFKEKG
jgi:hypothetical protein